MIQGFDIKVLAKLQTIYDLITSSPPGSTTWGSIVGTLSSQTDLQTALNAKVPYTGATTNVDLGEYQIKSGQVEFDQTPTGTAGVAVMRWNDTDGTVDLGLKGGNVTLQVGQETLIRVVNKTGSNLLESDFAAVRVRSVSEGGAAGQRLAVVLAQADNDAHSATTIGIVTENISNNQEGFITIQGNVNGINTTGAKSYGGLETWVDGDMLFLDPVNPGYMTNVKPVAPNHLIVMGYVVYAHAIHGKIYVKVDNGYELDELHNVAISSPVNNNGLFYNSVSSIWENKSIIAALGYTPYDSTNPSGYITSSALSPYLTSVTAASTYQTILPAASASVNGYLTSTNWSTFNAKQNAITLTTTGTSGAATLVGSTLNIPQYAGSGTSASIQFVAGSATGLAAGTTRYGSVAGTTAETQNRLPVSSACTINNLYVITTATMNASASLAVTIFKNGAATAVTLTIAGGSVAGTYSDTSNSATFAAGDGYNIRYVNSGSVAAAASSGTSFKITI